MFSDELTALKNNRPVFSRSRLRLLHPYIDDNGIIRVGGRLSKSSSLPHDAKHPIMLPSKCHISRLIFVHEHVRLLHVGPQALLSNIQQRYWVLCGRSLAKQIVYKCIIWFRACPKIAFLLMVSLPRERVTASRPFLCSGVDFCGPILVRSGQRRCVPRNSYIISVFVYMSTRAIHLELVHN